MVSGCIGLLNIGLDLFLILVLDQGIEGAAVATVIAQGTAASGILLYTYKIRPELRLHREDMRFDRSSLREITSFSTLTCVQQSDELRNIDGARIGK